LLAIALWAFGTVLLHIYSLWMSLGV
jgi:hypothetical protein